MESTPNPGPDYRLEGVAGGYGKYAALPYSVIEARFASLAADPTMRSIRATLRIAREQLESRGSLASYVWIAILFAVATAVLAGISPWVEMARHAAIACALIALVLTASVLSTRKQRQDGVAQESAIANAAVDTLIKIVETPDFTGGRLDWSDGLTLKRILRMTKSRHSILLSLVETAEN